MGATLTLMVGDGNREVLEGDSLSADESMGTRTKPFPKVLLPTNPGFDVKGVRE